MGEVVKTKYLIYNWGLATIHIQLPHSNTFFIPFFYTPTTQETYDSRRISLNRFQE